MDAVPRDSCAGLSNDQDFVVSGAEEMSLPVIARWTDVQRAKKLVVREKEGLAILQLRAGGYSEVEIGKLSERDRLAVRRRWRATAQEVLDRLGGDIEAEQVVSRPSMCLICGERPRARLAAVRRRIKGGWRTVLPERQAGVCVECLRDELAPRCLGATGAAA